MWRDVTAKAKWKVCTVEITTHLRAPGNYTISRSLFKDSPKVFFHQLVLKCHVASPKKWWIIILRSFRSLPNIVAKPHKSLPRTLIGPIQYDNLLIVLESLWYENHTTWYRIYVKVVRASSGIITTTTKQKISDNKQQQQVAYHTKPNLGTHHKSFSIVFLALLIFMYLYWEEYRERWWYSYVCRYRVEKW